MKFIKIIKITQLFIYSIVLLLILSCRRSYPPPQQIQDKFEIEVMKSNILLQVNKELIEEEAREIKEYVESHNWDMKTSESGLWYMIYSNGRGEKAATGKIVTLDYTLSLMDSTICYTSALYGQKTFMVGYGEVESGLHEGVQLMRVGDKARMIMPPHLAHGILGDGDCIPRRAIIVYDLELISIKN